MRRYCLTYDAIDSDDYKKDPNFYREFIVEALAELGCNNFHMPVATTIIFHHYNGDIDYLHNYLKKDFDKKIFYYMCLVDEDYNTNQLFDVQNPDNDLGENFYEFLDDI